MSLSSLKYPQKHDIVINKPNKYLYSFSDIEIPNGTQTLNLNNNFISDFTGLTNTNDLKKLTLVNNPILTFIDFPSTPELENIDLTNTPISELRNFRALCLIVAGPQLKIINGIDVNRNDRNSANTYGPIEKVLPLLLHGWLPVKPILTKEIINTKEYSNLIDNILKQEKDPFSLKATRILRVIGYSKSQIKSFIRHYLYPYQNSAQMTDKFKAISSKYNQIDKEQEIINILAFQITSMNSGNNF